MREIRIHIDADLSAETELTLPPGPAHHVARVLRLRAGQALTLFNGRGGQYPATIRSISGKTVTVVTGGHEALERESPLAITLVQGISRGRQMDYTLQKAVELGVNRIIPVMSEYSQVKIDDKRLQGKQAHWQGVVAAACEQCGRNQVPAVEAPQPFGHWLETLSPAMTCLLLDTQGGQRLRAITAPAGNMALVAGPEGGFSPAERQAAQRAGCISVALGPRILRTETAAPAAITACQALWGDLG